MADELIDKRINELKKIENKAWLEYMVYIIGMILCAISQTVGFCFFALLAVITMSIQMKYDKEKNVLEKIKLERKYAKK